MGGVSIWRLFLRSVFLPLVKEGVKRGGDVHEESVCLRRCGNKIVYYQLYVNRSCVCIRF